MGFRIFLIQRYDIQDCDYSADTSKIAEWNNVSQGSTQFKVSTYSIGLTNFAVEMKFNTINTQIMVGNQSNWVAGISFTDNNLYTHNSSGGTQIDTITSPSPSDIWRLEVQGTTIRLYKNNNLLITKNNCRVTGYAKNLRLYPQANSQYVDYVKVKQL